MGFIKVGDNMPIRGFIKDDFDGDMVCSNCNLTITVISILEDDSCELVCKCKTPDLE